MQQFRAGGGVDDELPARADRVGGVAEEVIERLVVGDRAQVEHDVGPRLEGEQLRSRRPLDRGEEARVLVRELAVLAAVLPVAERVAVVFHRSQEDVGSVARIVLEPSDAITGGVAGESDELLMGQRLGADPYRFPVPHERAVGGDEAAAGQGRILGPERQEHLVGHRHRDERILDRQGQPGRAQPQCEVARHPDVEEEGAGAMGEGTGHPKGHVCIRCVHADVG